MGGGGMRIAAASASTSGDVEVEVDATELEADVDATDATEWEEKEEEATEEDGARDGGTAAVRGTFCRRVFTIILNNTRRSSICNPRVSGSGRIPCTNPTSRRVSSNQR